MQKTKSSVGVAPDGVNGKAREMGLHGAFLLNGHSRTRVPSPAMRDATTPASRPDQETSAEQ